MKHIKNLSCSGNWLSGKTVLITGATSGIGKALALLLIEYGSTVVAHGRSRLSLDNLVTSARESNIATVVGDLSKEPGWRAVETSIIERKPDVLVLNAGYNCRKANASDWKDSEVFDMIQVNLISPILCARTFVGLQPLSEPRRLVLILSTSCHFTRPEMSLYITCKTGLMGFGKVLQQEAEELGVRTILFYPGRTDTPFRKTRDSSYMDAKSVAQVIASTLCLPSDVVPYEFTFRPEVDTRI